MAHLPQDELPSEFDVVVDGTGLVQSMLAAALSRAGKSVLHLDHNSYYGELWGSLMYREMQEWMSEYRSRDKEATPPESRDQKPLPPPYTPSEGEKVVEIVRPCLPSSVSNMVETVHTEKEREEEERKEEEEEGEKEEEGSGIEKGGEEEGGDGGGGAGGRETEGGEEGGGGGVGGEVPEKDKSKGVEVVSERGDRGEVGVEDSEERQGTSSEKEEKEATNKPSFPKSSKVTWQSLEPERRRLNFDLMPKMIYCRGEMVDVITESSCSRYLEFRAVSGMYCYNHSHHLIEQVPCSRSDVFSSKVVTMMEKRKMMKFLTFCADFKNHPQDYQDSGTLSFEDYLKTKELTPNLVNYILHSIAMVPSSATTLQGLEATQLFINSLGRYGNAPLLFPIFGGGELPQAFCRLSAVYGGVYCLQRHVTSLVSSAAEDSINSVICSSGQNIKCSSVVLSASFLTQTPGFSDCVRKEKVSRGIFVTDSPLPGTDGKLSLLTIPPDNTSTNTNTTSTTISTTVRVIQLDSQSNSCPSGTYMVHMQCGSERETAEDDLRWTVNTLFTDPRKDNGSSSINGRPRLLWSLYYNVELHSIVDHAQTTPTVKGVYVTSEPDLSIGYEKAAKEARELFTQICPEEEFLPHPPDPDDIIYDDSGSNHGNEEGEETTESKGESSTGATETEAPPKTNETTPTSETSDSNQTSE